LIEHFVPGFLNPADSRCNPLIQDQFRSKFEGATDPGEEDGAPHISMN